MNDDRSGVAEFWRGEAAKARELSASAKVAGDVALEESSEATARRLEAKADLAEQDYRESQAALARTLARIAERKLRAHSFGVLIGGRWRSGGTA